MTSSYVLLDIQSSDATEVHYLSCSEPGCGLRLFLARQPHHRYTLGHREGLFYVRTNSDAKDFQIVTTPIDKPEPANWKVFVPHQPGVLLDRLDLFKNFAVVRDKANALNGVRVHDFRTGEWHSLKFAEPVYSLFTMGNPEFDARTFRYSYQSLVTPPSDLRLRHAGARVAPAQAAGSARRLRPRQVRLRAAVGHGP